VVRRDLGAEERDHQDRVDEYPDDHPLDVYVLDDHVPFRTKWTSSQVSGTLHVIDTNPHIVVKRPGQQHT
jgi:hypothetical protein